MGVKTYSGILVETSAATPHRHTTEHPVINNETVLGTAYRERRTFQGIKTGVVFGFGPKQVSIYNGTFLGNKIEIHEVTQVGVNAPINFPLEIIWKEKNKSLKNS